MAPPKDAIWVLAQAVKAAIVEGYSDAAVDLPGRQFVSPAVPAYDCELLAVNVESNLGYEGALQQETTEPMLAKAGHALRAVRVAVHLIRCVPVVQDDGEPPSVTDEEDAAETILTDAQLLLNVIVAAQRAGDLPRCGRVMLEQWQQVPAQGGLGGGILRLRLGIE